MTDIPVWIYGRGELISDIIDTVDIRIIIAVLIAVLILKGVAMYKAARREEKVWFWCLLIFNTLGILPIIYLLRKGREY